MFPPACVAANAHLVTAEEEARLSRASENFTFSRACYYTHISSSNLTNNQLMT